jgi:hypothetical protein
MGPGIRFQMGPYGHYALGSMGGADLHNNGPPHRNVPAVKWPQMHVLAQPLPNEAQPGNSGVGGLPSRRCTS